MNKRKKISIKKSLIYLTIPDKLKYYLLSDPIGFDELHYPVSDAELETIIDHSTSKFRIELLHVLIRKNKYKKFIKQMGFSKCNN